MDFFILVTGTDAGEREDFMTEKIREYSMNGALIIGVDNGYGNMKTARRCFKTAIAKYDSAPVLSRDYIEYDGGYYVIGEGRKGFVADKQTDDDNYMLTLAGYCKGTGSKRNDRLCKQGKDSSCSWASSEMGAGTEGGL